MSATDADDLVWEEACSLRNAVRADAMALGYVVAALALPWLAEWHYRTGLPEYDAARGEMAIWASALNFHIRHREMHPEFSGPGDTEQLAILQRRDAEARARVDELERAMAEGVRKEDTLVPSKN